MKIIDLKYCPFLIFLLLVSSIGFSQGREVTGKVTDSTGAPIAHATVLVKGTNVGTQTADNGTFTINSPGGATTLSISSIGYEPQEVPIGNGTVSVTLQSTSTALANITIVSIGYGTLDKKEVSSAITHLSADDLTKVASNSALMSIQGKVAGLSVTNT